MTFNLLTVLGLREYHTLLDIGAGSLRIGRLLIPYLQRKHYFAVEPSKKLIRTGIRKEVGKSQIKIKQPSFMFGDEKLSLGTLCFDYAVAHSIFSHCGKGLLYAWLAKIAKHLKENGALIATFLCDDQDTQEIGWIYPRCVNYTVNTIEKAAKDSGLKFSLLNWAHPRQQWALFSKPFFDVDYFMNQKLSWNNYLAMGNFPIRK